MTAPTKPIHSRTPENTPIPGGGRWEWDSVAGAYRSLDEPANAPDLGAEEHKTEG